MYPSVYYGDKLIPAAEANLSVASSAVLYGLSVYTVFPVCLSKTSQLLAFRLPLHYERLINSCKIIGIDTFQAQMSYEQFVENVQSLVRKNKVKKDVFVRATVHVDAQIAGTRSRGLSKVLSMFAYDAAPILPQDGARLKTSHWRRVPDYAIPSRAKVNGAYVNSVLAKQDAIDSGYDDCVFLDSQGHVCELSAANIFMVRHGKLITPDTTTDLLEGINRRSVLEIARKELKLEVEERAIDITELYIADEVFATGTSANIAPILEIDKRVISDGSVGTLSQQLQDIHSKVLHSDDSRFSHWLTQL